LFSADDAPKLLNERSVLSQVFDENFRSEGLNSEVIELNDTQSIVVRVKAYNEAAAKPIEEVTEQIQLQLQEQKAAEAAKQFVIALMAKLDAGESIDAELANKSIAFTKPLTLARYSRDYDSELIQRLFQLAKPAADKVTRDYVVTAQGDYAIIELSQVVEAADTSTNEQTKQQLTSMLERSTSEATYQALVTYLLKNADISYTAN